MVHDAAHPVPEIAKRLEAIYGLHSKTSDFRLINSPYNDLLTALGDPHLSLPPVIHLAGTNGKGSTLAFLKTILETAGYSVHTYTSPHLLTFNERITLNGTPISDDLLLHYLDMTEQANSANAVTFFEYTTAMAFKAMADHPADICLIETGLGGRLDCTNIIPNPIATVITSIGYDHMEFLGLTLKEIAKEKAGIMKEYVPCIIAPQMHAETHGVFRQHALEMHSPLHITPRNPDLPPLGLRGDHQKDNASTAVETLQIISDTHPVKPEDIKTGLANTKWPARMEKIERGEVFESLPEGCELWFDCGHNAEGALSIGQQLQSWKKDNPNRPIHLILGLGADKDPQAFIKPLVSYIDSLTCVDLMQARCPQTGDALCARIQDHCADVKTCSNPSQAVKNHHIKDSIILVTGSLYLYQETVTIF